MRINENFDLIRWNKLYELLHDMDILMEQPWEYLRENSCLRSSFQVRIDEDLRIRSNNELYETLNYMDFVRRINIQRLCWFANVLQIDEDALARRVFQDEIWVSRQRLRPCLPF